MAYKKYAYYNKGNKVALIQQGDSTSSGRLAIAHCTLGGYTTKDTCEAAGGQWIPSSSGGIDTVGEYKSPIEDVTNGLQLEYTYAPIYTTPNSVLTGGTFMCIGWFVDENGYINVYKNNQDWDHANVSVTGIVNDSWIYINSSTIQGVHKVKAVGTEAWEGNIQLYTKMDAIRAYTGARNFDFEVNGTILIATIDENDIFFTNDKLFIVAQAETHLANRGVFRISKVESDKITVDLQYYIWENTDAQHVPADFIATLSPTLTNETVSCKGYKGYVEPLSITSASMMEDETFELDLTRYQSNAVVHYIKAKMFEDAGDIDKHEYYMRQFKKQLEKASGSRKYGPHMIQGHWSMRK